MERSCGHKALEGPYPRREPCTPTNGSHLAERLPSEGPPVAAAWELGHCRANSQVLLVGHATCSQALVTDQHRLWRLIFFVSWGCSLRAAGSKGSVAALLLS